ncbi:MAG: hypothetical protein Q4D27_08895 [Coriobacteriia bacterium]|nr:hypothetical protein [Coriobacteriia bacterium]
MMAIDPLAFASVLLNSFCMLCGGIACAYLCMHAVFEKRHALYLFFGYFVMKMLLISACDAMRWFGVGGDWPDTTGQLIISVVNVLVYFLNWYTWKTSLLKAGIAGIFADIISVFPMVFAMAIVNIALGAGPSVSYIGTFGIWSLARPLLMVGIFWVLLQFAMPLLKRFVLASFKHERFWLFLFSLYLAYVFSTQIPNVDSSFNAVYSPTYLLILLVLPAVLAYVLVQRHTERKRGERLAHARALMAECDDALRAQSAFLDGSRRTLDELARRIECLQEGGARGDLACYLGDLRAACDRLRFGTYSDNPALDVVLVSYEERFRAAGVAVRYRISPLSCAGEGSALSAQALLEWALQAHEGESPVDLRAFRRANQVLIEARVPVARQVGLPARLMGWRASVPGAVVHVDAGDGTLVARMLLEDGGR